MSWDTSYLELRRHNWEGWTADSGVEQVGATPHKTADGTLPWGGCNFSTPSTPPPRGGVDIHIHDDIGFGVQSKMLGAGRCTTPNWNAGCGALSGLTSAPVEGEWQTSSL